MKVAIVGSGLQANRRAKVIKSSDSDSLVGVFSTNKPEAIKFAREMDCKNYMSFAHMLDSCRADTIIICTPPNSHYDFSTLSLSSGKHVLVEKPFTQTIEQSQSLKELSLDSKNIIRCGFNHRFHPSIQALKLLILTGELGDLKFCRSLYGTSLREGYENEWRADKSFSAGGQFMEQGSHLVDLMQFILGGTKSIFLKSQNFILPKIAGEDSGIAILTHKTGVVSSITSTLLQWHNRFSIELFGDSGFAVIEGLGGSYGVETLKIGLNLPNQPFTSEVVEFRGLDQSWQKEWDAFKLACLGEASDCATPSESDDVMRIIAAGYESAKTNSEISII